jgi:hypothetical protein
MIPHRRVVDDDELPTHRERAGVEGGKKGPCHESRGGAG